MAAVVTAEIHGFSHPDATPTPWAVGLEHVIDADTFWLSTVRPDGRPHVTPLIAVWHGDAIWFTTGPDERKAKNLAENSSCVLTTGRSDLVEGGLDVVLEGAAEQVTNESELQPIAEAFAAKSRCCPPVWQARSRDEGGKRAHDLRCVHWRPGPRPRQPEPWHHPQVPCPGGRELPD